MTDRARATQLLERLSRADEQAAEELLPLLYDDLHRLARHFMEGEPRGHTLQPTALVHEAWLRLQGAGAASAESRAHFLAVAARAMRRVLIDHARRRRARKRDEGGERLALDSILESFEAAGPDLTELDEALERLGAVDPQLVRIVEQRFFAGATHEEIALGLGVSTRTVERGWKTAQVWLRAQLGGEGVEKP